MTLPVSTPGIVDVDGATLTVALQGASDVAAGGDDHLAVVRVNTVEVGRVQWDGESATVLSVPVPAGVLKDGENQVEIAGEKLGGVDYNIFYVNHLLLVYPRRYAAADNQLTAENAGYATLCMGGFTDPDIRVFDITNPRQPSVLTKALIEPSAAGPDYQVSFRAGSALRRYLALTPDQIRPCDVIADQPSYLKQWFNLGSYLILTSGDMTAAAQTLADYRASGGHVAKVVDIEDIYDEFSYGVTDAAAIREFLAYAYAKWRIPPQYVVLAGNGSFDYLDHRGSSDAVIPALLTGTPDGLCATDLPYSDVSGNDRVAEFALGRIPVVSADELRDYVDKVMGYESSSGEWTGRAILAADAPDAGGNFPVDSEDVAALFPDDYQLDRLYRDVMSTEDARAGLFAGINAGRAYVNFIGHGGPTLIGQWDPVTNKTLLSTGDLGELDNGTKLPVFTAMTCSAGSFGFPGINSLSEALVLKPAGGASAVWAPSGYAFNADSVELCKGFYRAVFNGGETVLGDAVRRSQENFAARGQELYHLDLYNLMGDPGLRLK